MHDKSGGLYPELDFRWVRVPVLAAYLSVSPNIATKRLLACEFGKIDIAGTGLRRYCPPQGQRVRVEIRPAILWMRNRLGRYADDRFDWRQIDGKVALLTGRLEDCKAGAAIVGPPSDPLAELGRAVASVIHRSLPSQTVLQFPGLTVSE